MKRRDFLAWVTRSLGAAAVLVAGVPVLGAVLSPWLRPGPKRASGFLPVLGLLELDLGVPRRVDIVDSARDGWALSADAVVGSAWLVRKENGSVVAFSTVCPHLGCPINVSPTGDGFRCPCHESLFRLNGAQVSGPSERPMDELEVQVKEDRVWVRYAKFKQGSPQKRES